jgi:hypothetical protein
MSYLSNSPQTDRDTAGGTVFPIASDYLPENAGYRVITILHHFRNALEQ